MKKSNVLIGMGAFALAICGFLATKANKKFVTVSGGKFVGITAVNLSSLSGLDGTGHFTTVKGTNNTTYTVVMVTKGTSKTLLATLYTSTNHSHHVYYRPTL